MATPAEISSLSSCFRCVSDFEAALLYLLAVNAGVTDPAVIAANSACYKCIPDWKAAVLYLLDNGGGGGGGGASDQVSCGAVDPVAAPSGSCALYYNTASTALFFWDGAAWILKA